MGLFSKLFGEKAKEPEVMDDIRVFTGILDRSDDINDIYIAGLAHHCSRRDTGFFAGVIVNDSENPRDKKAMAVFDTQKKRVLGYVPGSILSEYRKWCKEKCFCVGYIFYDGEALRGRVRAYKAGSDWKVVTKDATEYSRVVGEHFHWPAITIHYE